MAVSAAQVKELRERTGLGMMECKKALVETEGDIDLAIENLRKSGQAKAAKKASRVAAEGTISFATSGELGVLLEINSETDFVARDDNFKGFSEQVAKVSLVEGVTDVQSLMNSSYSPESDETVEQTREALVQKIGENIQVRRLFKIQAPVLGAYSHNGKIGVLVGLSGGDEALAKDIAMHIAAVNPMVATPDDVPAEVQAKEKEIFAEQARQSGKPEEIIEKMITGRIKKFLAEVSLVEQPFVKDPDTKVGQLLKKADAEVISFKRFEVGEGIEKEEVDFAAEVMAQAKGS